jgi:dihydroorotate dehydrogenase
MSLNKLGFALAKPILHAMDAERAHRLTIKLLQAAPGFNNASPRTPVLASHLFGLDFPNPLGLAAGFDKNAEVPDAMLAQGFGFVEVGTITPQPQAGNPQPRLFRLVEDQAVINRMGFNNAGHAAALARLNRRHGQSGIVGVNLGANKDATDRIADYVAGIATFAKVASYYTINVSSPNTPGLRNLQSRADLSDLLSRLNDARAKLAKPIPMLLKIAPDLDEQALMDIAACCANNAVDGVIISNTTITRPQLTSSHGQELGGLSGSPLFAMSTRLLAKFYLITEGKIPLVGAGGISSVETAWAKITAGASLVQLYSALVFHGPALITEILAGLQQKCQDQKLSNIQEAVGSAAHQISAGT